ncbi:MAG: hypothetical protein AB7O45_09985 [Alphaproteobacteria bacterium]
MIRITVAFWLGLVSALGYGVFQVKYEVQDLETRLTQLNRSILADQQAIHILKAEWSYLSQPGRIAELARKHLSLVPLATSQIGRIEDLPLRPDIAPPAPAPGPPLARHRAPPPAPPSPGPSYATVRLQP